MSSYIRSIGIANPGKPIPQRTIASFMVKAHGLNGGEKEKLEALFRSTGISNRYSVIADYNNNGREFFPTSENLEPFPSTKNRMNLFREKAVDLSVTAVQNCLDSSISPKEITHLITVSCTGMYAPGLDIDLVHRLGLPSDTSRTAINYMGCYAAINALKLANSICNSSQDANVLIVCVELCSIHFQKENSEDNYLANSIFGDGAAAALVSSRKNGKLCLELSGFYSDILQNGEADMAWTIDDFGFQMKLSSYVPQVIKSGIAKLIKKFLNRSNLSMEEIDFFAIHPGGKRILEEIEGELSIDKLRNQHAREVLRDYGNMSSPTVLFVVRSILGSLTPADKGKLMLAMAFGPGLTIEMGLFRIT